MLYLDHAGVVATVLTYRLVFLSSGFLVVHNMLVGSNFGAARACPDGRTVFSGVSRKVFLSRNNTIASCVTDAEEIPQVGWLWDSSVSRTKAQLKSINARPKKALGQNFVTDQNVLHNVVEKSDIRQGDLVLEIGPGTGNLTRSLLKVIIYFTCLYLVICQL